MTYSQTLAANRQRFAARQQNSTRITVREQTLGPVSNTILVIVMACFLGLLYLTQVTKTNTLSYQLNDLKTQESSLKTERNDLEVSAARLQSLERVRSSQVTAGLVSVSPSGTVR
jgi:cell division protein FtsL